MKEKEITRIIKYLNNGEVGVIPTDTIYGISASAHAPASIKRIYEAKQRDENKKLIVLISTIKQLPDIGVDVNDSQLEALKNVWPGAVSVELSCTNSDFEHLHKGTNKILVRLPKPQWLKLIIDSAGPIVSTSANKAGQSTSSDINTIKDQLPGLDFYVEGEVQSKPSKIYVFDENNRLTEVPRS